MCVPTAEVWIPEVVKWSCCRFILSVDGVDTKRECVHKEKRVRSVGMGCCFCCCCRCFPPHSLQTSAEVCLSLLKWQANCCGFHPRLAFPPPSPWLINILTDPFLYRSRYIWLEKQCYKHPSYIRLPCTTLVSEKRCAIRLKLNNAVIWDLVQTFELLTS